MQSQLNATVGYYGLAILYSGLATMALICGPVVDRIGERCVICDH